MSKEKDTSSVKFYMDYLTNELNYKFKVDKVLTEKLRRTIIERSDENIDSHEEWLCNLKRHLIQKFSTVKKNNLKEAIKILAYTNTEEE